MLKDSLYKIVSSNHLENTIEATLDVNKDNKIFIGHFPDHPVLPGACMLQMVKEVLENELKTSFRLKKADNMKFLALIDPTANNIVILQLSYKLTGDKSVDAIASLSVQKDVCFKFKGSFIQIDT